MPDDTSKDVVYERVLDFARREIEEASAEMDELRQALRRLEERVEAAKSVYEAVAARLNLEDELAEEAHRDGMPDMPLSEEPEPQAEPAANNEAQDELASIQQSLEARDKTAPLPIDRASASDENADATDDDSALSEAERTLIGEHLRSKRKG